MDELNARVCLPILLLLFVSTALSAATNDGEKTASGSSTTNTPKSTFVVVLSSEEEATITPDPEKFRKEPRLKNYNLASFEDSCRRHIALALEENPKTEVKEIAFYRLSVRGLDGATRPPILLKIGDFATVTVRKRN
jgi:hypothetical protein